MIMITIIIIVVHVSIFMQSYFAIKQIKKYILSKKSIKITMRIEASPKIH